MRCYISLCVCVRMCMYMWLCGDVGLGFREGLRVGLRVGAQV